MKNEVSVEKKGARRVSTAEKTLMGVCLLVLVALFVGAWTLDVRETRFARANGAVARWRLARPRARMASALVGNEWWVLGGITRSMTARGDAEVIDLANSPGQSVFGAMAGVSLLPRFDHTAEAVGPNIYIFGGLTTGRGLVATGEKFDTRTGKVSMVAPMPSPRRMAHSVAAKGKVYVVGGSDASGRRVGTLEIYDVASNSWSKAAPMKVGREADVALWNGQLVVAGGYDAKSAGGGVLKAVESFDLKSGRWRTLADLSLPISAHHVTVSGDWLFLWGDYVTLSRVLAYNARTGQTRELKATKFLPRRHTVAVSSGNRVFVAGGNTSDMQSALDDVQIFDAKQLVKMATATK